MLKNFNQFGFVFLKFDFFKNLILVILLNSQIPPGYLIGGMIVDVHQKSRGRSLLPCMVTKGFAKGMTADIGVQPGVGGGFLNQTKGLIAA